MLGSDYSGDQGNCPFFVYGFIMADEQASPEWPLRVQRVRQQFLKDDRRMSEDIDQPAYTPGAPPSIEA